MNFSTGGERDKASFTFRDLTLVDLSAKSADIRVRFAHSIMRATSEARSQPPKGGSIEPPEPPLGTGLALGLAASVSAYLIELWARTIGTRVKRYGMCANAA